MKKIILAAFILSSLFISTPSTNVMAESKYDASAKIEQTSFLQRIIRWFFNRDTTTAPKIATTRASSNTNASSTSPNTASYLNDTFGIAISYPQELKTKLSSEYYCKGRIDCDLATNESLYLYNYTASTTEYDVLRKTLSGNDFRIRIEMTKHDKKVTLDTITPTHNEAQDAVVHNRVVINSFDAAIIKDEWGFPAIYYLVNKDTSVKMMVEYTKNIDSATKKIVENIVSSFRFTR